MAQALSAFDQDQQVGWEPVQNPAMMTNDWKWYVTLAAFALWVLAAYGTFIFLLLR